MLPVSKRIVTLENIRKYKTKYGDDDDEDSASADPRYGIWPHHKYALPCFK